LEFNHRQIDQVAYESRSNMRQLNVPYFM